MFRLGDDMKTRNATYVLWLIGVPVLILGFQNCGRVGTNGIAVDGQQLSLVDQEIETPSEGEKPPTPTTGEGDGQGQESEEPGVVIVDEGTGQPGNPKPPVTTNPGKGCGKDKNPPTQTSDLADSDVAKAVLQCKTSGQKSVAVLNLQYNHENVTVDADYVSSVKGVWGSAVVRASHATAKAQSIQINNSTLVLCNFQEVAQIKGTNNKIVVVGGEIKNLEVNNSVVSLVEAKYLSKKGPNTVVRNYSLK